MSDLSEGIGEDESVDYWMSDWAERIQDTAITPVQNGVPFDAFSLIQPRYFSIMGEYASRRDKENAAPDEMELVPSHQQETPDETESGPSHQQEALDEMDLEPFHPQETLGETDSGPSHLQKTPDETESGPSHQQEALDEMDLEPSHQQETPDETEPEPSHQQEAPDEMELESSDQQPTPDESEPEPSHQQGLLDKTESTPSQQQESSDENKSTPNEPPDDAELIIPTNKIKKLRDLFLQDQKPVHVDVENLRYGIEKPERDIGQIISRAKDTAALSLSSTVGNSSLPAAKTRRSVEFKYTSFITPETTYKSASSVLHHSWKMEDRSGPSCLRFVEVYDGDEASENADRSEEGYGTHGRGNPRKRKRDQMN
ncbi:hypothetical protein BP6252_07993 [Coleophoma cylindrospora]|uniref:Uncharacterized protein n=1 Tax=Coleophoma cylindrospora TaxID=1849047 RepID=A0A3D8RBR9_9HELO|nr:hypothetical protein BP6252_07993 [Coleophoma cylindrospora]